MQLDPSHDAQVSAINVPLSADLERSKGQLRISSISLVNVETGLTFTNRSAAVETVDLCCNETVVGKSQKAIGIA